MSNSQAYHTLHNKMAETTDKEIDVVEKGPELKEESKGEESSASVSDDIMKEADAQWTQLMGDNIQMRVSSESDDGSAKECRPQDAVVIDFVGRHAPTRDDDDGPIFQEGKDWLIVIGDKYVSPALEMGVRFMKHQQKAVIWSHSKFAHGVSIRKHDTGYELPPNSNVRYEVHVKAIFCPDEGSDDPDSFQLKLGLSKKLIANDIFKNELYKTNANQGSSEQRAIRLYSKAADEMLSILQSHQAEKEKEGEAYKEPDGLKEKTDQATEIMLDCLNNIIAVYLKAKKYHEAKEAAVKVLTHDPRNYKALLRAARAAMMDPAGTYEESDAAIAAAEKVVSERDDLDDKDVRKLRQELKQKKQEYKKRKKEMMARMTKELKPKSEETKSKAKEEAGGADDTATEEDALLEPTDPLWRRLLPYAFQIMFPFALYFIVVYTSQQRMPDNEPTHGEL